MSIIGTEDARPLWPRVVTASGGRRLWEEFEVDDRLCTMTHGGSNAVSSGVPTTDNEDILISRIDVVGIFKVRVKE